jgi:hypothetical protein
LIKKRKLDYKNKNSSIINRFSSRISITSIENLPNEVYYEIFSYLDGCKIHHAFFDLNHRFQQLLNCPSLLFRIKLWSYIDDSFVNDYKQIIHFNRQQIFSLNLKLPLYTNGFFSLYTFDSSLDHLESLILNSIEQNMLNQFLPKLISLSRLLSLTINMENLIINPIEIYQTIFNLPMLKYYKFIAFQLNSSISLSIPTKKQFSPIEYLVIDHYCTFNELFNIVSYTPQLRRLNLTYAFYENPADIETISPMILSNLSHLSSHGLITFDEFEMFINKIYWKLKVLSYATHSKDIDYLNAKRWEEFILKYLPDLEKFYFKYFECLDHTNESTIYCDKLDQFNSLFWIERQWIFETEINLKNIIYLIHPKRFSYSKIDLFSNRLIIKDIVNDQREMDLNHILNVMQINHLEISKKNIFVGILIQIINLLPKLKLLKIYSLSLHQTKDLLYTNEFSILCSTRLTSEIIHVYLEKMNQIQEIYFLMILCPYMTYLTVDYSNDMNIQNFLRTIFNKINYNWNNHPRSLFMHVPKIDDQMIRELDKMIRYEKLLLDYTIERVIDKIYLQWK